MKSLPRISRRRVLSIIASAFGAGLYSGGSARSATASARWRGIVMNAPASLVLFGEGKVRSQLALKRAIAEARRLERIFSLYDSGSALSRLNRDGRLALPPPELVRLLADARAISQTTEGAFDATMQPLWRVYAEHFAGHPGDSAGPSRKVLSEASKLIDYRAILISLDEIAFARKGMSVSLNGIAQGYVTDRVTDVLRSEGFAAMMVDLGEPRMSGSSPEGDSWPVAIADPEEKGRTLRRLCMMEGAVATSQGAGTVFEPTGRHHHLFDPRTGASARHYRSLTVTAPTATRADGLSTGFFVLSPDNLVRVSRSLADVGAFAQLQNGDFLDVAAERSSCV